MQELSRTNAIKAGKAVVRALPAPVRSRTRRSWRRIRPVLRKARPDHAPLVSIVVPAYGVERYLGACLDSLLNQSHRNLQIIAVDDGSPDSCIDIMQAYAARDPRVEILQQPNAGLGAARNNGAKLARGRYLMFFDSDDTLLPGAVATYVQTLEGTGSDFAVSLYRRMNSTRNWRAAPWVRSAHQFTRLATTLAESPDIQVNAVAWSKCYRREFWVANSFQFPERVLYEDQAVSARAYAVASTFDIVSTVTCSWRVRENRTSITQQAATPSDLRERFRAAFDSLDQLCTERHREAHDLRLVQLLSNDFSLSIAAAQHADTEYWSVLRDGLRRLVGEANENVWARVSAQHRVAIRLVVNDLRDAVVDFTGLGGSNPKNSPSVVRDGRLYIDFPIRQQLGLDQFDPLFQLADHQTKLVTGVRRAYWNSDGQFEIYGWAYIDNVDLTDLRTEISLRLVDDKTSTYVTVPLRAVINPEVSAVSKHRYANYEKAGFTAVIDPATFAGGSPAKHHFEVCVGTAGIVRTGPLAGLDNSGSAGRLRALSYRGFQILPEYSSESGLGLTIVQPSCLVTHVDIADQLLRLRISCRPNFAPLELRLEGARTKRVLRAPLRAVNATEAEASLRLPGATALSNCPVPRETWIVRAVASDGRKVAIGWDAEPDYTGCALANPRPFRTKLGNLGVLNEPLGVLVERVKISTEGLVLGGHVLGGSNVVFTVSAPKVSVSTPLVIGPNGSFTVTMPLVAEQWNFGPQPLATGTYKLECRIPATVSDAVSHWIPLHATEDVVDQLPLPFTTDSLRGRIRLTKPNGIHLLIEPLLTDQERGSHHQRELQDALTARLPSSYEPGAVLFRSYFGEVAGCNPLAVHHELRRRNTGHTLYWAVRDASVRVPEGGIPVIQETAEWYRLLHDAEFYLDNMHQMIYHKKPRHQIQIQTFHGYPFKQMGQSHWKWQQRDKKHVQSYLDRAKDWDYLVSPASYGTELLCAEFGFDNTVLEIGYPRNDVLQNEQADAVRAQTRARLGIHPDQTVIMYAPTFRDSMAVNDFRAQMVDFLDHQLLAAELGDDFVILVRGHAFNARVDARVGTHGNTIDVTDYPCIEDLCLASDAAILDYSSLRFDYSLTGKPMIFMVPDLVEYQSESRGALFSYEPTAPGPLVSTTLEVLEAAADLDEVAKKYAYQYAMFKATYTNLDDGHATERLVDAVFGKK